MTLLVHILRKLVTLKLHQAVSKGLFFLIPRIRESIFFKKECGDISLYPTYHS